MLAKFSISYTVFPNHNKRVDTHYTDDPVEAEMFISQLLKTGADFRHQAQRRGS